jgi:hypothetical protein
LHSPGVGVVVVGVATNTSLAFLAVHLSATIFLPPDPMQHVYSKHDKTASNVSNGQKADLAKSLSKAYMSDTTSQKFASFPSCSRQILQITMPERTFGCFSIPLMQN